MLRIECRHLVENGKPARGRTAIAKNVRNDFVLHNIARNQGAVRLDKGQLIAFCMRSSEPEQSGGNTAKVDGGFLIKRDIRWPQYYTRQ